MENSKYEAFLLAAEYGSLTAAAQTLGYTQSGITRIIKGLEEDMGFALFVRTKNGVALTENGKLLLPYFRDIAKSMQSVRQLSADISGSIRGNISIGSCYSMAALWLPAVIKGFQSLHPGVTISLREDGSLGLARALAERTVDISFGPRQDVQGSDWTQLFEDEIVAWVPEGHPAAERGYMELKDLEELPFIHTQPGQDTEIDRLLARLGIHPNVRFTTLNAFTTYNMVEAGLGVSLDQRLRSREWHGAVEELSFRPVQKEAYGMALPSIREVSPATRTFIDYVRSMQGNL